MLEALWGVLACQAHDAEAGSKALFGVGPVLQDVSDKLRGFGACFFCPVDDPRRRPLQIPLMAFGHVSFQGGKLPFDIAAWMTCHPGVLEQDLHGSGG